jgi:hypothetical protein
MLIPYGILSAAGAGGVAFASDYELIQTFTVGTAAADITFSSLGTYSSTYKHLQLRLALRTTRAAADDVVVIQLNGDTGANYAWHQLLGNGSAVSSSAATGIAVPRLGVVPANSATANIFGGLVVDLLDPYSTTKNTTIRSLVGFTSSWIAVHSVLHISTSAISSIRLLSGFSGNIAVGSRLSLYGIKG